MNTLKHASALYDIKNDSVFSMSHLPTVGKMKMTVVYKLMLFQVVIVYTHTETGSVLGSEAQFKGM